MAAKVEWQPSDLAAQNVLAEIMDESGLAYRSIAEAAGSFVSHVRIGDIHNGNKAPVRLSEFLAICFVCHADPVATLNRIIDRANQIKAEQTERPAARTPTALAAMDPDRLADLIAADPAAYDIAALHDPYKDLERETPRD